MAPVTVVATGMVTGVGLDAASTCAAIRCAIDRFEETRFMDQGGEWIIGSQVPLDPPVRGREKILRMAASAINECAAQIKGVPCHEIPLLLCLAEQTRPGRFAGLDDSLIADIERTLSLKFRSDSTTIANGRIGGVDAMKRGAELIEQGAPYCLAAGADTFLAGQTLSSYESKRRLLTSRNSNGFIPGEAAGAMLLGPAPTRAENHLNCLGLGFGRETATIESEEPLRGDGLADAIRAALNDAGCGFEAIDYRITDANGEQYVFKEATLGLMQTMRILKPEFDIWHAADCIGEVGAASVFCALAVARSAGVKGFAPGPGVLAHFGNDSGERAAIVLTHSTSGN